MPLGGLIEVILYVENMAESAAFYRDRLGLRISYPVCESYADEYWVVFDTGACKLCLHGGGEGQRTSDKPKIVFHVDDIHKARGELIARGVELSEVRSPGSGIHVCDGFDSSGNPFSIEATT